MAISVTGPTLINNGTAANWSAGTADTDQYIEGAESAKLKVSNTTSAIITYDQGGVGGVDMSGQHWSIWIFVAGVLDTTSNGGFQMYVEDTAGATKTFNVGGSENYGGGWQKYVVSYDAAGTTSSGTYDPTIHRYIGIRFKTLSKSIKENCWWDASHYHNELTVTSGTTDGISFDDIVAEDNTNAWGLFQKKNGIFVSKTGLIFGSTTSGVHIDFSDAGQVLIFAENSFKSSTLYKMQVLANATGTINFTLGTKSGTSGISGCVIKDLNASNKITYDFDDSNIDILQLYGCSFLNTGTVTFPTLTGSTNYEAIDNSFDTHGKIFPNSFTITGGQSISADDDAISISSGTFNVTDMKFISPTNNAFEVTAAITVSFSGLTFVGTTGSGPYDVDFTAAGTLTINATDSNVTHSQVTGGGTVVINNNVEITLTGIKEFSEVRVYDAGTTTEVDGTEQVSVPDGDNYQFSFSDAAASLVDIVVHHTGYQYYRINDYTIPASAADLPVDQKIDRVYNNP